MSDTFLGPKVLVVYTREDHSMVGAWVHAIFLHDALYLDKRIGDEFKSARVISFDVDVNQWIRSL